MQRPLLKWLGGKTSLLDKINPLVPTRMQDYYEPFLGGGSMLLNILHRQQRQEIEIAGQIYASDANTELINFYVNVQQHAHEFAREFAELVAHYHAIPVQKGKNDSRESFYYSIRKKYNSANSQTSLYTNLQRSAMFLFLNKTCFRGMYREGPNGFNVPFGNYKSIGTSVQDILNFSRMIENVVFAAQDFQKITPSEFDFVYLDPPYAPESATSFVAYQKSGFGITQHNAVFALVHEIDRAGAVFLLSNAAVDIVIDSLSEFCQDVISARRAINAKKPNATTREVLIYNL